MSFALTISSSVLQQLNPQVPVDPSNMSISFTPPIDLGSLQWEIGLFKLNSWFTNYNVFTASSIKWSKDNGSTYTTVNVPPAAV